MSARVSLADVTGVDPKLAELKADLLASLRRLDGRGTVGDVAAEASRSRRPMRPKTRAIQSPIFFMTSFNSLR